MKLKIIITTIILLCVFSLGLEDYKPKLDEYTSVAVIEYEGKYGLINNLGKEILPTIYSGVSGPIDSMISVSIENENGIDKWGYFDVYGKQKIQFKYDKTGHFSNGLAPVKIGNKWGYLNKNGELVIDALFDDALCFSSGRARVRIGNRFGYINYEGEVIIDPEFEFAGLFIDSLANVSKVNGNETIIDLNGVFITDTTYTIHTNYFFSNYAETSKRDSITGTEKYGLINKKGELVIPFVYDDINSPFDDQIAIAGVLNDTGEMKYGYINLDNQNITDFEYDILNSFTSGIGVVGIGIRKDSTDISINKNTISLSTVNGKYGAIDIFGNIIIPIQYNKLYVVFSQNLKDLNSGKTYLIGDKNDRFGVIDNCNNIIIPFLYDEVIYIGCNQFRCKKDDVYYLIDLEGEISVSSAELRFTSCIDEDRFVFKTQEMASGKWGLYKLTKNWKVFPVYDNIGYFYSIDTSMPI